MGEVVSVVVNRVLNSVCQTLKWERSAMRQNRIRPVVLLLKCERLGAAHE